MPLQQQAMRFDECSFELPPLFTNGGTPPKTRRPAANDPPADRRKPYGTPDARRTAQNLYEIPTNVISGSAFSRVRVVASVEPSAALITSDEYVFSGMYVSVAVSPQCLEIA